MKRYKKLFEGNVVEGWLDQTLGSNWETIISNYLNENDIKRPLRKKDLIQLKGLQIQLRENVDELLATINTYFELW